MWKWYESRVIKIVDETVTTKRFWLEVPELESIDFKAGQFITADLPIHAKRLKRWRSYSIANAPDGSNVLELCVVYLPGGLASEYLFKEIKVGDSIKFKGPSGVFVLPESLDDKELVFICTGTGVAPFRSMVYDLFNNKNNKEVKIHLIFGTRTVDSILYFEEFKLLQKQHKNFKYTISLSRQADWTGDKGYVHPIYERDHAQHEGKLFFLCGWQYMVDEARDRLLAMGVEKERILLELYG